jgi:hypothetical protein
MNSDLTVVLENRTGTLADMGEALGKAGINIEGICEFPSEGQGVVHILVRDADSARKVIEGAGIHVLGQREVLLVDISNNPGELGKICRRIADTGGNIELVYITMKGQLALGTDNLDRLRAVL